MRTVALVGLAFESNNIEAQSTNTNNLAALEFVSNNLAAELYQAVVPQMNVLRATATWESTTIPADKWAFLTVTVPLSVPGNQAQAAFASPPPLGVFKGCDVTANNTVTIALYNQTGQPVTVGTQTVDVLVTQ